METSFKNEVTKTRRRTNHGVCVNGDTEVVCNGEELYTKKFSMANSKEVTAKKQRNGVRVFKSVESMTNQLVSTDKNFQAIYNVVVIQFVLFIFYVTIKDSVKAGRFYFDVQLLYNALGASQVFMALETYLLASFLLVYPLFKIWKTLYSAKIARPIVSFTFIIIFISYIVISGVIVASTALSLPLPPITTVILSVEQLRLSMKAYSFVRENAYKVIYPWHKDDSFGPALWYAGQMSPNMGSFTQYLFFLFAPTLLYRDYYPRNEGPIKWNNVASYFIQFLTTIWYLGVIGKDFTFPSSMSVNDLVHCYISSLMSTFFGYLLVHTCVFHGFMNFMSELLRFADREFYQDWWTSTSFSSYYRKWNTIVHDWIYSYLYRDMKSVFHSPLIAVFATIFVSAFVHEYLLALALRFASPVLLLEFAGLGVFFYLMGPFGRRRTSNLFVLLGLSVGGANLVFYYQVELAARLYCPKELNWITFFKPRMFECYYNYNSSQFTM